MRVAAMGSGRASGLKQEQIVLGVTALLVVVFSSTVGGFLTTDNLLTLVRNVSTLGILGTAMAIVVIGGGMDLSLVATMGVATAVLNIARYAGPEPKDPAPRWYIYAIAVTALICGFWPMAVGSGVANGPFGLLGVFEDTGMPGGPPGDRSLDSHGRRVRAITEEEYQRVEAWQAVMWTGLMACFSGMTLAGALYFHQGRSTPIQSLQQTAAAGSVSGSL